MDLIPYGISCTPEWTILNMQIQNNPGLEKIYEIPEYFIYSTWDVRLIYVKALYNILIDTCINIKIMEIIKPEQILVKIAIASKYW